MKKIYLVAMGLAAFGANAQLTTRTMNQMNAEEVPSSSDYTPISYHNFSKAAGDVIFSETFPTGSLAAWTAMGTDGAIWAHDLDGPNGTFSTPAQVITSTTAANGFLMFDGDGANPATPYTNWSGAIASPIIDMSGISNAVLAFQHSYRTCCENAFNPLVEVSTDGFTTVTAIPANFFGSGANVASGTRLVKINLDSYLASATNLNNFQFRFNWEGSGGTSHYFWQVDDIAIIESHLNDLHALSRIMVSGALEIPYYNVPLWQQTDITFSGEVRSDGANGSTGVGLNVAVNNGGGSFSSPTGTLASGSMDSLVTATTFLPAATAALTYNVDYSFVMTETDGFPTDNALTDAFDITANEYSVHNDVVVSSIGALGGQAGQSLKIGNVMEIMQDDRISDVYVRLATTATNVGQDFFAEVYRFDGTDYIFVEATDFIPITAGNNGTRVKVPLLSNVDVFAGDDLLVVACHSGNATSPNDNIRFATAQPVQQGIVLGFDGSNSLFSLTGPRAVMVGLHLDRFATISENESINGLNIYPNPAQDNVTINYSLGNASNVTIEVMDVTGKVVSTLNEGVQTNGGHQVSLASASFEAGVYYVTIATNDSKMTKKFVKK